MSRLQYHRSNQLKKTIVIFLVVLFLLFYLFMTYGLRFLINASISISSLFSKKNSSQLVQTNEVFGRLSIDSIPSATNSGMIEVSGSIINFDILDFYINDKKVKETELSTTDNYDEQIGDLVEGNNEIYIIAKTKDGQYKKISDRYTVFYKKNKPKLEITDPQDQKIVSSPDLIVKGTTDKETFIKINDSPVVVDANGGFTYSLHLQEGENKINITASDMAGNSEEKTFTVSYQKE